ncbi:symmetrical bis(5'-nucleosyl)-tetraphosphatase [Methylomicrobium lacus]|uniref:symmetrical bis(5'-nucleosyl)-tetraphosphatase n=1 Tax=Methylomicrobium lacus TaxID=136992 RepID=UPI00045EA370|nr:symmetrical bis(5'-nucleosyl)-tetraphosphatase [Methylomicrobium lacus]
MAIYAIGDVQGCYDDLLRLLDRIAFDPATDYLWMAGDLVNRGPKSLEVLRFVKSLGERAVTVLGNHDLHLVAAHASGIVHKKDTFRPVLEAEDADELIDWLRRQPLFHTNGEFCLLHAGLPPQWDLEKTQAMAALAEQVLQGDDYRSFLQEMYGNQPNLWSDDLEGVPRLRFIVNCFTRMRFLDAEGRLDFTHDGRPGSQPPHLMPWFAAPNRKNADLRIVFGHWSQVGYYEGHNCYGIDTGCLWGGQLTALRLGDPVESIGIDCPGYRRPGKAYSDAAGVI